MAPLFSSLPVGLPGIAVLALGGVAFVATLLALRWRRPAETGARRDPWSILGIALQGAAFAVAGTGPVYPTLDPLGGAALGLAALTALLIAGALALFVWAARTMGRQWSLVARTRSDHQLVTDGPFAYIRHPIYTGLALLLFAVAAALGHEARLLVALPLYALGTAIRVRIEERLLATAFGPAHAAYAARVRRFLPRLR